MPCPLGSVAAKCRARILVVGDILFYGSIPIFAFYFYLFQRTFRILSEEDRKRFHAAALQTWRRVLGLLPIPLMLDSSHGVNRVAVVMWFLLEIIIDTCIQ